MNIQSPVFVWRDSEKPGYPNNGLCIYCGGQLKSSHEIYNVDDPRLDPVQLEFLNYIYTLEEDHPDRTHAAPRRGTCERCGWWRNQISANSGTDETRMAALQSFDINDSELHIKEITSHLEQHYSDIFALAPRRFEEVIAHVYREIGWDVHLTKQSRDGGVDLYCFSNSSGKKAIVECKRYAHNRKVGIAAVDRLIGVSVRTNINEAHLVTSSYFSSPAKIAASESIRSGIQLNLIDAHDLLKHFGAYSDPNITVSDVRAIFNNDLSSNPRE